MRVWSYVITTDRGSAPNYDPPAVTLAVCKPRIRGSAKGGDLVLAFNGKPLAANPHSMRWAGIVSEVILMEHYWNDPRFRAKRPDRTPVPDNIYRLDRGTWVQVPNPTHDAENIRTDLSGRNILVFDKVWYFGATAPELPGVFDLRVTANRRIEPLRQISGDQWLELQGWLTAHDVGLPVASASASKVCRPAGKGPRQEMRKSAVGCGGRRAGSAKC